MCFVCLCLLCVVVVVCSLLSTVVLVVGRCLFVCCVLRVFLRDVIVALWCVVRYLSVAVSRGLVLYVVGCVSVFVCSVLSVVCWFSCCVLFVDWCLCVWCLMCYFPVFAVCCELVVGCWVLVDGCCSLAFVLCVGCLLLCCG